jgi:glycerol uptake facilitator-like aquaporin
MQVLTSSSLSMATTPSTSNLPQNPFETTGRSCLKPDLCFLGIRVRPFTSMSAASLQRRVTAEFLGTLFLVATVIGSGIMAERLAGGNVALALLANTIATGAILVALIFTFGGVSGAHFNPAVTVADALEHGMPWREVPAYIAAQCSGGLTGAVVAHLMFGLPPFSLSRHARSGGAQVFSEFVATFGLLAVIWGCSRVRANSVPFAVGAYITAAYWFTSSTSFANPAVTIARAVSDTFAGIRPVDVPLFVAAQMCGAIAATVLIRRLIPSLPETAEDILLPHESRHQLKAYLFACVHNAGRSQMAAALFNLYADRSGCLAISAGTQPADHIDPEVMQAMREIGVDLGSAKPQLLTRELAESASVLVTMGCGEACPFVPSLRTIVWALPDPKGQSLEAVRTIRDEIHARVKELIRSECAECCKAA